MSSPTLEPGQGRLPGRRLLSLAAVLALTTGTALVATPARSDPPHASAQAATSYAINGAGYGHGRGMSQYGAYGAAKRDLSWQRILAFYYPGTKRSLQRPGALIKVWISADSDNDLRVLPARGLKLSDGSGHSYTLPTGAGYRAWRVKRSGQGYALSYQKASGSWAKRTTPLKGGTWWFSNQAKVVKVWVRGGVRRELRGTVGLVKRGTGGRTVNRLAMEDYVRAVVPAEMPTSWHAAAVRAQAVAARSYAARLQSLSRSSGYDACDTTNCQVYRGYASTRKGHRTVHETKRGNAAVKATARTILTHRKAVVLTEFGPSNGGSTAGTSLPYQVAKADPYDALITSHTWTRRVTAASVARAWPGVGTVKRLSITKRTGVGRWGGRVLTMKIVGSKRTVTVTGTAFQSRLGLRSNLFTVR